MGDIFSCLSKTKVDAPLSSEGISPRGGDGYWSKVGEYWWEQWPLTLANTMVWYEFAIYSNMEPYISQKIFGNSNTITWGVYSLTFITEPLGGLLFGTIADRFGRRPAVLGALVCMCCATIGQGLTPPVAYLGPVWIVACRILQGLGAGGESGSVSVFLAEQSHTSILTMSGMLNNTGCQFGFALSSLTSLILLSSLGNDVMLSWGWRVPFLLLIFPGSYTIYSAFSMPETTAFEDMQNEQDHEPWRMSHQVESLKEHWVQGVVSFAGSINGAVLAFLGCAYLQEWVVTYCGASRITAFWLVLGSQTTSILWAIPFAWYGDHYGIGHLNALGSGIAMVTAIPMYAALLSYPDSMVVTVIAGAIIPGLSLGAAVGAFSLVATAFPTEIRVTAFSICWTLSGFPGGVAPVICTWTGIPLFAGYYTTFFAAVTLVANLLAISFHKEYQKNKEGYCLSYLREELF